ncbi:MAG: hypothetical protein EPN86_05925 [Nanoarchaeota archaeon]|nr:MAG: hypothetical protein EPN86_05925 [Nanoarchaeota archaeon]
MGKPSSADRALSLNQRKHLYVIQKKLLPTLAIVNTFLKKSARLYLCYALDAERILVRIRLLVEQR